MSSKSGEIVDFVSGGIAGACAIAVSQPLDYVKVILATQRSQAYRQAITNGNRISIRHLLFTTVQQFGIRKLYRGMGLPIMAQICRGSLGFLAFGSVNRWLTKEDQSNRAIHDTKYLFKTSLLSGVVAGILTSVTIHPSERIKVLMQVSNSPANKTKALSTIKNVYTQLGVRGLFRGYCVVLPMDIISGALYFGGNNICKQMVAHEQGKKSITDLSAPSLMCCGIVSGISSWLVIYPLDVIRNQMMASTKGSISSVDIAGKLYHRHGYAGFYRGIFPTLLRVLPHDAAFFTVYGMIARELCKLGANNVETLPTVADITEGGYLSKQCCCVSPE